MSESYIGVGVIQQDHSEAEPDNRYPVRHLHFLVKLTAKSSEEASEKLNDFLLDAIDGHYSTEGQSIITLAYAYPEGRVFNLDADVIDTHHVDGDGYVHHTTYAESPRTIVKKSKWEHSAFALGL